MFLLWKYSTEFNNNGFGWILGFKTCKFPWFLKACHSSISQNIEISLNHVNFHVCKNLLNLVYPSWNFHKLFYLNVHVCNWSIVYHALFHMFTKNLRKSYIYLGRNLFLSCPSPSQHHLPWAKLVVYNTKTLHPQIQKTFSNI